MEMCDFLANMYNTTSDPAQIAGLLDSTVYAKVIIEEKGGAIPAGSLTEWLQAVDPWWAHRAHLRSWPDWTPHTGNAWPVCGPILSHMAENSTSEWRPAIPERCSPQRYPHNLDREGEREGNRELYFPNSPQRWRVWSQPWYYSTPFRWLNFFFLNLPTLASCTH